MNLNEGFVAVGGHRTWYGITGDGEEPGRLPVLVLHGGPGLPHDYLEPLASLAQGRRVIFYDQIGCGRSERPPAGHPWSLASTVAEVGETRAALGLDGPLHLYGQSYGGFLALEHVLGGGQVASLILANTAGSMPSAAARLLALRGDDPSPQAQQAFMQRHFFGGDGNPPEPAQRAFAGFGGECYSAIWGTGVTPSGPLRDWDVSARLGEIKVPTLIFNGADDQLTPDCGRDLHRGIEGSRFHVFDRSAHLPFFTEPEAHHQLVSDFLAGVEIPPLR
jgi:pimeloyl-ACP methyl ester carboxylesterase